MGPTNSRPAELALPVASLAAIRRALAASVGADAAAGALLAAGHAAGDAMFRALCRPLSPGTAAAEDDGSHALRELSENAFWTRLAQLFSARGWGSLVHGSDHPGIGSLRSPDWVEADPASGALRPGCFFTTGLLANLLGHVAGEEVAVMEVECRAQGDAQCRFLFGSGDALDRLFRHLESGDDVESSIAALT